MTTLRNLVAAILALALALAPALDLSSAQVASSKVEMSDDCAGMATPCDPATMVEDCDMRPCCNVATSGLAGIVVDVQALDIDHARQIALLPMSSLIASTRAPPLRPPLA